MVPRGVEQAGHGEGAGGGEDGGVEFSFEGLELEGVVERAVTVPY